MEKKRKILTYFDKSFADSNLLWPGTVGGLFPPVSDGRQFRKLLLSIHCSEKAYVIPPRFWL